MKRMIVSATSVSPDFTQEERDLIESMCYESWVNYKDERNVKELARIAWDHVEWLMEDVEDVSGNVNRESVIEYAEKYIHDNFINGWETR